MVDTGQFRCTLYSGISIPQKGSHSGVIQGILQYIVYYTKVYISTGKFPPVIPL